MWASSGQEGTRDELSDKEGNGGDGGRTRRTSCISTSCPFCGRRHGGLPPGYRAEAIDTKHPNDRMQDFVKWLAGRSSAVFGLSEQYATMQPTGADFRAQQLMTAPAIAEAQKWLESICDWVLYRFVRREIRRGELAENDLPANWLRQVSWPGQRSTSWTRARTRTHSDRS